MKTLCKCDLTSILITMGVRLSGKAAGSLLNFDPIENRDLSYHKKSMITKVFIIYLQKALMLYKMQPMLSVISVPL